jgi:hypothetical protein
MYLQIKTNKVYKDFLDQMEERSTEVTSVDDIIARFSFIYLFLFIYY